MAAIGQPKGCSHTVHLQRLTNITFGVIIERKLSNGGQSSSLFCDKKKGSPRSHREDHRQSHLSSFSPTSTWSPCSLIPRSSYKRHGCSQGKILRWNTQCSRRQQRELGKQSAAVEGGQEEDSLASLLEFNRRSLARWFLVLQLKQRTSSTVRPRRSPLAIKVSGSLGPFFSNQL